MNADTKDRILVQLGRQAQAIAAVNDNFEDARDRLRAEEADLIRQVVARVRVALTAVSDQVQVGYCNSPDGKTEEFADWVGLRVDGKGPVLKAGVWQGRDLFLGADGCFHELHYTGSTKGVAISHWAASVSTIEPSDVVETWNPSGILSAISEALAKEAGGRRIKRTAEIDAQIECIRALVVIVRSWAL